MSEPTPTHDGGLYGYGSSDVRPFPTPTPRCAFCGREPHEMKDCPGCQGIEETRRLLLLALSERDEKDRQLTLALKGKRPFSTKLADEVIAGQVKEIDRVHAVIAEERRDRAALVEWFNLGKLTVEIANGRTLRASSKKVDDNPVNCISAIMTDRDALAAKLKTTREALERLRDCDFVITPADRMDAVRDIARAALESTK